MCSTYVNKERRSKFFLDNYTTSDRERLAYFVLAGSDRRHVLLLGSETVTIATVP